MIWSLIHAKSTSNITIKDHLLSTSSPSADYPVLYSDWGKGRIAKTARTTNDEVHLLDNMSPLGSNAIIQGKKYIRPNACMYLYSLHSCRSD